MVGLIITGCLQAPLLFSGKYQVVTEMGRSLTLKAGTTFTRVENIKVRKCLPFIGEYYRQFWVQVDFSGNLFHCQRRQQVAHKEKNQSLEYNCIVVDYRAVSVGLVRRPEPDHSHTCWNKPIPTGSLPPRHLETQVRRSSCIDRSGRNHGMMGV